MLAICDLYRWVLEPMVGLVHRWYGPVQSESVILEPMLSLCLRKANASGSGSFLIVETERTLYQMCTVSLPRLMTLLLKNLQTP